jgi:hypothetical protein
MNLEAGPGANPGPNVRCGQRRHYKLAWRMRMNWVGRQVFRGDEVP